MELKYQFAIRNSFRISIKRLLAVLPVICVQYLESKFNKETYMNGHNFNIHTVSTITQCMDH